MCVRYDAVPVFVLWKWCVRHPIYWSTVKLQVAISFQVEVAFAKIHISRCAINSRNRYTDYRLPFYYLHFRFSTFSEFPHFSVFHFHRCCVGFFSFFSATRRNEETVRPFFWIPRNSEFGQSDKIRTSIFLKRKCRRTTQFDWPVNATVQQYSIQWW